MSVLLRLIISDVTVEDERRIKKTLLEELLEDKILLTAGILGFFDSRYVLNMLESCLKPSECCW